MFNESSQPWTGRQFYRNLSVLEKKIYLPEQWLIRHCSVISLDQDRTKAIKQQLNSRLNWAYIVKQTQKQDVAALLYYHLSRHKERLPKDILDELKNNFNNIKNTNLNLYDELKKILVCFKENNIESIILKGIDLAIRVYPDIGLRPMTDIDLLIRKQDLLRIEKALTPLNYLMYPKYHKILDKPTSPYLNTLVCKKLTSPFVSLHLHWHLLNNTFYPVYGYISDLDIERIWKEAQPNKIDGIEALIMAPEHLLLYLSEHHLSHYFDRLILLTDIDALLNHYQGMLDWQKVVQDAFDFNFNRPLFYSLYFASEILRTNVPQDMLLRLRPPRINRFENGFVDSVLEGKSSKDLSFFMFLAMNKATLKKIIFIFRTFFPDPKFRFQLQDLYGTKSSFKYTLNHLIRIFKYILDLFLKISF